MKFVAQFFVFGLLSVSLVFSTPTQLGEEARLRGIIDGIINSTINKILQKISDPIAVESLALNFSQDFLNGQANISSFKLFGLKELAATKIDVNIFSLALNATIQIPHLSLSSKYFADVTLAQLLPLYGNGRLGFNIDDIEILVGGKASLSGGLSISNVTVAVTIGDASFDFHGLMNNEEFSALVDAVLNENLKPFIDDNKDAISRIISPIAGQLINAVLKKKNDTIEMSELREVFLSA